jgi:hypothetical protein
LRLGSLVRLLPGVRREPGDRETFVVETRIARLYPVEILHLLGFRKLRRRGSELSFARRRHDRRAPARIDL